MSADTHDGLLCHHGEDAAGHPNGPTCPVQVKVGRSSVATIEQLIEHTLSPAFRAAYKVLRTRKCWCRTDKGTLCRNRAATSGGLCRVHE